MAEIPDVHYARSGGVAVAYQVVGDGPRTSSSCRSCRTLYSLWQLPVFAARMLRLAESSRLILVNTRGMGLSDRPRGLTIEARMDDVRAVMDAVGSERATLLGWAETSNTCGVFAATYPERVERLILYPPYARGTRSDDYPWAPTREEALAVARRRPGALGRAAVPRRLRPPHEPAVGGRCLPTSTGSSGAHRLSSSPAVVRRVPADDARHGPERRPARDSRAHARPREGPDARARGARREPDSRSARW